MKKKAVLSLATALALTLAACSGSVADSVEGLCSSLAALDDTMQQIAGADVSADTTTIDTVQNAVDEMESAVADVQTSESDLGESLKSQLQDDFDQLKSAIEGISGDSTVAEAGDEVASAVTTFKQSWDQTLGELNCSTES